jgi:hypothetical protein
MQMNWQIKFVRRAASTTHGAAMSFARDLAGSDPMQRIVKRVVSYWDRTYELFVSSNDADVGATVAIVTTQLGFAPAEFGGFDQGGAPLHVVDGRSSRLLFQNLAKLV